MVPMNHRFFHLTTSRAGVALCIYALTMLGVALSIPAVTAKNPKMKEGNLSQSV